MSKRKPKAGVEASKAAVWDPSISFKTLKLWTQSGCQSLLILFLMTRSRQPLFLCLIDSTPVSFLWVFFLILDLFLLLFLYLWLCQYEYIPCVPSEAWGGHGSPGTVVVFGCQLSDMWLGIEHWPSGRAVSTLNPWGICPAPGFSFTLLVSVLLVIYLFFFFQEPSFYFISYPVSNFIGLCSCFSFLYSVSFGCVFAHCFLFSYSEKPWSLA